MVKKNGFTLIELLIAVSIIAILAVVGIVIYQGQQKNARDARRRVDVEAIASALEANKAPGSISYTGLDASYFSTGAIPNDPLSSNELPNNACPGVCKYCVKTEVGACARTDTVVGDDSPGNVATWTVCANLENGSFFCRSNSQ